MPLELTFLGAAGTVTGSKYLVRTPEARVLVDCGLFQGFKQLRLRNWAPFPIDPRSIDAVILSHAHLDHSGVLPILVKQGFTGPVLCTEATRALCRILLPDSGHLQERDAEFANRHGFSKHHPALPLYTQADAERALEHFESVPLGTPRIVANGLQFEFRNAGHILGAAITVVSHQETTLVFSGDLGRPASATLPAPEPVREADFLILESTYGDRRHDRRDPEHALAEVIQRTVARGGTVLIPAFAVGRTQTLLYHLHRLKAAKRIPDLAVFLDSPMALDASEIYCRNSEGHRLSEGECREACAVARPVRDVESSKALDRNGMPKVIISASGMATGGRVLHHLKHLAPDPRNTILFTGFQAGGTRGAALTQGAESIKIHGAYVPVRAEVVNLQLLSAHADADEILQWLGRFEHPPRSVFITHGEPAAADALSRRIAEELGWDCQVPEQDERVVLS